jgi:hypothetical protein
MSLIRSTSTAAALALVTLVAVAATSPGTIEVARVRFHLDSVLTELSARNISGLSAQQWAHRSALITTLRAYRDRGLFPRNYDFADEATPYFVDRETGTLCAVAQLLASTGRGDIVARVARANNNVRVRQLAADTALAAWLDANGFTLAEAARIQVVYVRDPATPMQIASRAGFILGAPLAVGASLVTSAWNVIGNSDGHRKLGTVLGLVSGIAATGMGLSIVGNPDWPRNAGALSAVAGGVGIGLATRALMRHHTIEVAQREAESKRLISSATIAPVIGAGAGGSVGMAVSLRF